MAIEKSWFLTFKVNFLSQKLSEAFWFFFSLKNINLGTSLLLLTFFENFNFWTTLLLKSCQIFNHHLPNVRWSAKKISLWESAIFHSIKPPFDSEVAEKNLNCYLLLNDPLVKTANFSFKCEVVVASSWLHKSFNVRKFLVFFPPN